jgi:hypothetical protein
MAQGKQDGLPKTGDRCCDLHGTGQAAGGREGQGELGIRLAPEFSGRTSLYFLELRSAYSAGNRLVFLGPPPVVPGLRVKASSG